MGTDDARGRDAMTKSSADSRISERQSARDAQTKQLFYQQLLTCMRGTWHSLVVVPAEPGLSARPVAEALVEVSGLVRGNSAKLFPAEGLEISGASKIIVETMSHVENAGLAVASIDSVVEKQSGVPIVMAADAALLCVHLGLTTTENARKTIELIGRDKFIGVITIAGGTGKIL
jgi:hypothetical protein